LLSIRERIELLGGRMKIRSAKAGQHILHRRAGRPNAEAL